MHGFPSVSQLYHSGSGLIVGLLLLYFAAGYAVLWAFLRPSNAAEWLVLLFGGALWSAF